MIIEVETVLVNIYEKLGIVKIYSGVNWKIQEPATLQIFFSRLGRFDRPFIYV